MLKNSCKTITKEKIAHILKEQLGFSSLICSEIVTTIFDEIITLCKNHRKISLKNFGKFYINSKNSRPGLNIKTKTMVEIGARDVLRFIPTRELKHKINNHDVT
jgi:nucleoid DNA-binding protein